MDTYLDANGKEYLSNGEVRVFTFSRKDLEGENIRRFYESHSGEKVAVLDDEGKPAIKMDSFKYIAIEFQDGSRGYALSSELSLITV